MTRQGSTCPYLGGELRMTTQQWDALRLMQRGTPLPSVRAATPFNDEELLDILEAAREAGRL